MSDGRTQEFLADTSDQVSSDSPLVFPVLSFTGERIVPGAVSETLFQEHEARYIFASRFVKDKDVLDVACGTGIGTHYLLKAGARSCTGLDIDGQVIDYAKTIYKGCEFAQGDATNVCASDCCVDIVVSFETIEHIKDHGKFLSECHRILRPGGILICSTPNRTMSRWAPENPHHVREFTVTEFRDVLEAVFSDIKLFGQQRMNVLLYASQRVISRALHALRLMDTAKRLVRWKIAPPLALRTEFGGVPIDSGNEIRPYPRALLMQPRYVIAVGRKSP